MKNEQVCPDVTSDFHGRVRVQHLAYSFVILLSDLYSLDASYIYVAFGNRPWVAAIFYGLKRAVLREGRSDDVEVAFRPSQDLLAPWIKGSYI